MSTYTQFLYQLVFGSKGSSGFTYHISSKESLINYVKNQAEHHKTDSYKDELIRLLTEHNIDYIEDYLFI